MGTNPIQRAPIQSSRRRENADGRSKPKPTDKRPISVSCRRANPRLKARHLSRFAAGGRRDVTALVERLRGAAAVGMLELFV